MKKLITFLMLSTLVFGGGSFSLTMMYVGTAIIEPVLAGQMSQIKSSIDEIKDQHTSNVYEQIQVKNKEIKNIYKLETLIAVELKKSQSLDEQILTGEVHGN